MRPRAGTALLALALLVACSDREPAPTPTTRGTLDTPGLPARFAERLAAAGVEGEAIDRDGEAYALAEVASDSGAFVVQWADLSGVALAQVLGPRVEGVMTAGAFHSSAPSSRFETLAPGAVLRQQQADDRLLAVINGAFFETPGRPATQLAFPIAEAGRVVTGGSSLQGPGRPGAGGERWGQPLRVLGLDSLARVADYDPGSGAPLGQPGFREAVVSYAPDAHPARVATRFHILGALDADGDGPTETLIVITSDGRTTIEAPASLLTRLGVAPEAQIALDGGASVLVWNRRTGLLHQPTPAGGNDPQRLPHYLTFRLR